MNAKATQGAGNRGRRSVRNLDVARISQAGSKSDEEMAPMFESAEPLDPAQVLMDLEVRDATYRAALVALTQAIQPSLATFLQ
jgi:hypothetical protein